MASIGTATIEPIFLRANQPPGRGRGGAEGEGKGAIARRCRFLQEAGPWMRSRTNGIARVAVIPIRRVAATRRIASAGDRWVTAAPQERDDAERSGSVQIQVRVVRWGGFF